MNRDDFRARVADLLRRSGVDDADQLLAALDAFVLDDEAAAALSFAFTRSHALARRPLASQDFSESPTYVQILTEGTARKLSVGHMRNTLHGTMFNVLRVWGADL